MRGPNPEVKPGRRRRVGDPVELVDEPRKPPPAPKGLGKRERELWRELWGDPVAALWSAGDGRLVVRLAGLLARLERDGAGAPGWCFALAQSLEDRLALNPRARRAAGIMLMPPPVKPVRPRENGALTAGQQRDLERDLRRAHAAAGAGS